MIRLEKTELLSAEKQRHLRQCAGQLEALHESIPEFDRVDSLECCIEKYDSPKVSVILPVHNTEKYLFHCLSSILKQTCREFEVVCVDDCSTDSSSQILEFFALLDARVRVIRHEKNLFAGVARNTGMAHARGEYLCFVDSDDWCEPDLLEEAVKNGDHFHSEIVVLRLDWIDEKTKKAVQEWGERGIQDEPFSRKNYKGNIFLLGSASWERLIRRDFIESNKIFFPDIRHSEDICFTGICYMTAARISCVKKGPLYHYRVNVPGSLEETKSTDPLCFFSALQALRQQMILRGVEEETWKKFLESAGIMLYHQIIVRPPKASGFSDFYEYLHSGFIREFELESLPGFANEEIDKVIQTLIKDDHACDFLLDMLQYYHQFPGERDRLQSENNALQGELNRLQSENNALQGERDRLRSENNALQDEVVCLQKGVYLLQHSVSFGIGRAITWPLRMTRNTFRCLRDNGLCHTLKRIPAKFVNLGRKFSK